MSALEDLYFAEMDDACEAHFASRDILSHPDDKPSYEDDCKLSMQVAAVAADADKFVKEAFSRIW